MADPEPDTLAQQIRDEAHRAFLTAAPASVMRLVGHQQEVYDAVLDRVATNIMLRVAPQIRADALRDLAKSHRPACESSILAEAESIERGAQRSLDIMEDPHTHMPECQTHSLAGQRRPHTPDNPEREVK